MKVLVTAASRHGATAEIAEKIGQVLRGRGLEVTVAAPGDVDDIEEFGAVVLGSAVYSGHWLEPATALVDRLGDDLAERPVWLFSSGPVGEPSRKLVQKMGEDPLDLPTVRHATRARDHRMFAGKLEKRNLRGLQRVALTVFRSLEGDFRDWPEVEQWASDIAHAVLHPA